MTQRWFNVCTVPQLTKYVDTILDYTQQTRDNESVLGQSWPAVLDVGPTLTQQWFNVSCLLGRVYDVGSALAQRLTEVTSRPPVHQTYDMENSGVIIFYHWHRHGSKCVWWPPGGAPRLLILPTANCITGNISGPNYKMIKLLFARRPVPCLSPCEERMTVLDWSLGRWPIIDPVYCVCLHGICTVSFSCGWNFLSSPNTMVCVTIFDP